MIFNRFHSLLQFTLIIIFFAAAIAVAQDTKEFKKNFPFNHSGTVSINTYKGTINIETWDKNEVYFHAIIEADDEGWNSTSPEEQLERCEVKFDYSENYLKLESKYDKNRGHGYETLALVHYTIKMPASAELNIDDYKSETLISGLNSSANIESYKGKIELKNYSGELDIETYKGDVEVNFSSHNSDCKFDTYKGDIVLKLASNSKFDFDFELGKKGDFSSDFDMKMTNYKSDDGDLRGSVNGGGSLIEFSTYKGEIELIKK